MGIQRFLKQVFGAGDDASPEGTTSVRNRRNLDKSNAAFGAGTAAAGLGTAAWAGGVEDLDDEIAALAGAQGRFADEDFIESSGSERIDSIDRDLDCAFAYEPTNVYHDTDLDPTAVDYDDLDAGFDPGCDDDFGGFDGDMGGGDC